MFVKVWYWKGATKWKGFLNTDYVAEIFPSNGWSEVHMSDGSVYKIDDDSFDTLMTTVEHECGLILGEPMKGKTWREWLAYEKENWGDPKC